MFSNCYLYNKPTDDVTLMCQEVESHFKLIVKKVPPVEVELPPDPPKPAKATPKSSKKSRPPPVKKEAVGGGDAATLQVEEEKKSARLGTELKKNSFL